MFEFHRNDKFDARPYTFTAAQAAAPKPEFKWHQYGYTASGPIVKNRVFFMSNFEGYIDNKTILNNFTVPSAAMRIGRFLGVATAALDPGDLYGRRRRARVPAVPGQPHSGQPDPSDFAEAARVLSGAERGRHA